MNAAVRAEQQCALQWKFMQYLCDQTRMQRNTMPVSTSWQHKHNQQQNSNTDKPDKHTRAVGAAARSILFPLSHAKH